MGYEPRAASPAYFSTSTRAFLPDYVARDDDVQHAFLEMRFDAKIARVHVRTDNIANNRHGNCYVRPFRENAWENKQRRWRHKPFRVL